jgi:hypothetical protein
VAWDGGARGAGTLRTYYTVGKANSDFAADDEIASQDWVRKLIAGETGKPRPAAANHAAMLALTGMNLNDWIYVDDDTYIPDGGTESIHAGETWAYAYDGIKWVELVRINEVQVQDDGLTIEIDSVTGKRQVKAGGISSTQLADGAAIDSKIGNRTLADQAASGTLVPVDEKGFTAWLQGIRNNLKDLFAKIFTPPTDPDVLYGNDGTGALTTYGANRLLPADVTPTPLSRITNGVLTLYINSTGGSDSNDGYTAATAKQTLLAALNLANSLSGLAGLGGIDFRSTINNGEYSLPTSYSGYLST